MSKILRLPIVFGISFLLVGGAVFGALFLQANNIYKQDGYQQASVSLQQLSTIAGDMLRQRINAEMEHLSLEGVPDPNMIRQHMNAVMQSFPGQIIIMNADGSDVPATSITQEQLDSIFPTLVDKKAQSSFELNIRGIDYFIYTDFLRFTASKNADFMAFYLVRSEHMLKPYQTLVRQIILLSFVGVILLFFCGMLFGKFMSVRMDRITNALLSAEQGLKPEPLGTFGTYEFCNLSRAVNILLQGPTEKDKVRQQANTDALTGVLNRRGFVQAIDERFSQGGESSEMSVMFLDLDGFKPINDTYGHDVGDSILKEVAKRLGTCTREQDLICRLGGDEFVLLFPTLVDRDVLTQRADSVLAQINEPYWVGDSRVTMGVSIGISIGPADGKTGEQLLASSDEAMYTAKKTGKNQYTFYS